MRVWLEKQEGCDVSKRSLEFKNPSKAESTECRTIEFEVKTMGDATEVEVSGFVLANLCEDDSGQCSLRRKDFKVAVPLAPSKTKSSK